MKTPGVDTKYTYAVARIRVLETRLLGMNDFERILEEEPDKTVRAVSEFNDYSNFEESLHGQKKIDKFFSDALLNAYNFIYNLSYDKSLIEPFFKKQNFNESDSAIWLLFYNRWRNHMFLNEYIKMAIDLENIKMFFRVKIKGHDKNFLNSTLLRDGYIRREDILDLFDKSEDELAAKAQYYRYNSIIQGGAKEYRQTGKISMAEKSCDDILIDYIKRAKYLHFGIEPLVSYILAKENEIKNLRIILIGKENAFKDEEIRQVLRKSYV